MRAALQTIHGSIAMANDLVSLTDIWHNAGKEKMGNHPAAWCADNDVKWHGDDNEVFASAEVAVAYARFVDSDVMANIIQAELKAPKPVMQSCNLPHSKEAADSSRAMLLSAFKAAGVHDSAVFAKLTNHLYVAVLGQTARGLQQTYQCDARSVRKSLDNFSLLKVMTAEMNLVSYIYAERIQGYADMTRKIQQIGPLVQSIFTPRKH